VRGDVGISVQRKAWTLDLLDVALRLQDDAGG
jgi:hypothetical protein